jgi:uncharacterized protein (TIGR00661 family)
MKTIAYYISDYGYGHATRSIAIIRKLLEREQNVKIIICHSFALKFIQVSLSSNRISFRSINTDIGYVLKKDTIQPDTEQLNIEFVKFIQDWVEKIEQEKLFLQKNEVNLVISDISPLGFEGADSLGIPSIGLSNFTWYTAYQGLIEEQSLAVFKQAYDKMTKFYSLAGSREKWEKDELSFPFFSRYIEEKEVQRIRKIVNPDGNKSVIFVGLGMNIENELIEQFSFWDSPDCIFITSSNMEVDKDNVYSIPKDYLETQNYIAASDLVISKAGWGIASEAVAANVPLLLINRKSMNEDQNTIHYLKEINSCETIEWEELRSVQFDIDLIKRNKKNVKSINSDTTEEIATEILKLLND